MNIQTIAEHKVDLDLLPEEAKVLDLGCRGFEFTDELRRLGHTVFAVDIDKFDRDDYFQIAISDKVCRVGIKRNGDPQATCIGEGSEVMCMDLKMFMLTAQVDFFDLIKMDVEGSELEIIMSLEKAPAKQMSIEFHIHTEAYTWDDVENMVRHLFVLGYDAVDHQISEQHGMGKNYWSSLFVLK